MSVDALVGKRGGHENGNLFATPSGIGLDGNFVSFLIICSLSLSKDLHGLTYKDLHDLARKLLPTRVDIFFLSTRTYMIWPENYFSPELGIFFHPANFLNDF